MNFERLDFGASGVAYLASDSSMNNDLPRPVHDLLTSYFYARRFLPTDDPVLLKHAERLQREGIGCRLSDLHRDLRTWLFLQGTPAASIRQITRARLVAFLAVQGHTTERRRLAHHAPAVFVRALVRSPFALSLASPSATPLADFPLALFDLRRLPSDDIVWQQFSEDCLVPPFERESAATAVPGTSSRRFARVVHAPWDMFCRVFWGWLLGQAQETERGTLSRAVRRRFSRQWLQDRLERESCLLQTIRGVPYVLGLALRDDSSSYAPPRARPDRTLYSPPPRRTKRENYWQRRERVARTTFSMPVDDLDHPPAPGSLPPNPHSARARQERHRALVLHAHTYLDTHLVEDLAASVLLHDLHKDFASFLDRQGMVSSLTTAYSLEGAFREALRARQIGPGEGSKNRLRRLHGYRLRTPAD